MRVTLLGTGAAGGVPLYGCACAACQRAHHDAAYQRLPCCALVEDGATRVLIDAGLTDLHTRFPPGSLTAIVLTHFHPDHVQGLFHLRWGVGTPLPVYGPPDAEGCADLYKHPGLLRFERLAKFEPVHIGSLTLTPLPLVHSKPTFGLALRNTQGHRFAYLTDTVGLPPATEAFLRHWQPDALALDCSHPPQPETPRGHNDWPLALQCIAQVQPRRAWLTHLSHEVDAWQMVHQPVLPAHVHLARDGDVIVLDH